MEQFDELASVSVHSVQSTLEGGHLKCACMKMRIHTAPLLISFFGIAACTLFTVFYFIKHEYILLFPLGALYINHFLILLGNRLRSPKFYAVFIYSIKFLITILCTSMLFYIYVVVGDQTKQLEDHSVWTAFCTEKSRVIVALLLLLFSFAHRWFLRLVKLDYDTMEYERLVQRTATIYSLISEVHSRDEQHKGPYNNATTILLRPPIAEV